MIKFNKVISNLTLGYKMYVYLGIIYSMLTTVNNTVQYDGNLLRGQVDLKCPHHTPKYKTKQKTEVMNMITSLIVEVISQCIHMKTSSSTP